MRKKYLVTASLIILIVIMADMASAVPFASGNGLSMAKDAKAAGAEAAQQAKEALVLPAKIALVFDSGAIKDKAAILEGVCSVFDAAIVFGCPGYAPLTQQSNQGTVAVLALGGDIEVNTAIAGMGAGHAACGKRIAKKLQPAAAAAPAGKLLILFGACHVPENDKLVKGACALRGDTIPIIGGASLGGNVYNKGKVIKNSNIGILLTGDFACGMAMKKDNSPEGLITSAKATTEEAFAGGTPALAFVFNCGGRREKLGKNLPKELEAIKSVAGDTPLFGFYGSGEIGHLNNAEPAFGDGYHISVCALTPVTGMPVAPEAAAAE